MKLLLLLLICISTSSAATLSWDAATEGTTLSERRSDVYNITLSQRGFDPIVINGAFNLSKNSSLSVDTSAYDVLTYGSRVDLFVWDKRAKGTWGEVTINGLSLGSIGVAFPSFTAFDNGTWRGSFVVAPNSIYLDNLDVIPEPSTFFLFCIGLVLFFIVRKYRKKR